MSKSNRFKVIHRTGILIRDVFEYLLTEPIDEKKEEYYRKIQTKYYYLEQIMQVTKLRSSSKSN